MCPLNLFKDSKFCPGCGKNVIESDEEPENITSEYESDNNETADETDKVCKNCGEKLNEDEKFCPNCGDDLTL